MVAIKKKLVAKKKNLKGRTLHDTLHEELMRWTARFQYFTLLQKEKEKKESSGTNDLFQHYKAAETFKSIKFAIFSVNLHFKFTHLTFWTMRGEKRKTGNAATCAID